MTVCSPFLLRRCISNSRLLNSCSNARSAALVRMNRCTLTALCALEQQISDDKSSSDGHKKTVEEKKADQVKKVSTEMCHGCYREK